MANNNLNNIADIVENAPLSEILDTIEVVAAFIPGVNTVTPIVCKVLRILMKVQPTTGNLMHGIANAQQEDNIKKYASFIPSDNTQSLNILRTMVDIALEDGELTKDEKSMLLKKAEGNGIDADLSQMGLKKCFVEKNTTIMKQKTIDNIKTNALAEKIKEAIQKGSLESQMSLFRMDATEIGLSDADLDNLIKNAKKNYRR